MEKSLSGILLFFMFFISICLSEKLQVSVFYEALCPGSIKFITNQLYPNYKKFENYLDLELIPFGFTTCDHSSGHWEFKCQHGPSECYINKIESVVLANNPISPSLEFINCVIKADPDCKAALKTCATINQVSWDQIEESLSSGQADELLIANEKRTNNIYPEITYLPTIIFNKNYNKELQEEAETNFRKVVCRLLKNSPNCCKFQSLLFK